MCPCASVSESVLNNESMCDLVAALIGKFDDDRATRQLKQHVSPLANMRKISAAAL